MSHAPKTRIEEIRERLEKDKKRHRPSGSVDWAALDIEHLLEINVELLAALEPFTEVQPPYDHDNECSFCRTSEGKDHPASCAWVIAKAAIARAKGQSQ